MTEFKAIKPDVRILLLQVLFSVVLLGSFHTVDAIWALFSVLALVTLFFCGRRVFLENVLLFAVMNGMFYGLNALKIPVLSDIFPPFLTMLIRMAPAWLTLTILNTRSRMDEMLYALDRMYIPKSFSIPLMVVYRYVPTIFQELRFIRESLKMRGLNSWRHPWRTLNNHVVPLLARSEKISEELSAVSLCKGLSAERRRTSCTEVRIERVDILYLICMLLTAAALVFFDRFEHFSFAYENSGFGVQDIDLTIQQGELIVLTGPSGCGKTTLARCINGLIPDFYEGTITGHCTVDGMDIPSRPISATAKRMRRTRKSLPRQSWHAVMSSL